jgi:hypothetical protein
MQPPTFFRRLLLAIISFSLALIPLEMACSQTAGTGSAINAVLLLQEVLHELKPHSKNFENSLEKFREFVKAKFDKKTAAVSFKIQSAEKRKLGNRFSVESEWEEERVGGTLFFIKYILMPPQGQNGMAPNFQPGSRVKAVGEMSCTGYSYGTSMGKRPGLLIQLNNPVFN